MGRGTGQEGREGKGWKKGGQERRRESGRNRWEEETHTGSEGEGIRL